MVYLVRASEAAAVFVTRLFLEFGPRNRRFRAHRELHTATWKNYGWTSKAAPRPYSFETIFGSLNPGFESDKPQNYDENEVRNRLSSSSFTSNLECHPTILRQIMKEVCESGALICGIHVNCPDRRDLRVWFESCKENDLVFTAHPFYAGSRGSHVLLVWIRSRFLESFKYRERRRRLRGLHCLGRRRGFIGLRDWNPKFIH